MQCYVTAPLNLHVLSITLRGKNRFPTSLETSQAILHLI